MAGATIEGESNLVTNLLQGGEAEGNSQSEAPPNQNNWYRDPVIITLMIILIVCFYLYSPWKNAKII